MSVFIELSLLLALTTVVTLLIKKLKQPLVVGYILTGIIAGPYLLDILHSQEEMELFSKVGIVFLLFIIGLYLNPKVIREVGKTSLVTGVGQVLFTSIVGFVIAVLLGIEVVAAVYVAIALTFSSTIIILKLISDKKDLQKLYAKIAIGFLLVQDIIATIILIVVSVAAGSDQVSLATTIGLTLLKASGLVGLLWLANRFVLPKLINQAAQSQELLFLFSLAWGTGFASLFVLMGFSIEIGALIAGVMLSVTPYANEVASRLKPLRDFFIIIFFILLGSQLVVDNLASLILPAIVLSAFVLIGNPIIVILLMNALGYNKKTGFMAGLTVAQISEFSLILATLGFRVGHVSQEVVSLITIVGLITIAGSTYLILYAEKIYPRMQGLLAKLELIKRSQKQKGAVGENFHSVVFGYDRVGHYFTAALQQLEESFLVVDFNPSSIELLDKAGLPYRFGDAADVEFLEELPLKKPKIVISTVPDINTNVLIVRHMLAKNKHAVVIPLAQTTDEAKALYDEGATYVLMPHYLGAEHMARIIKRNGNNNTVYQPLRERHLAQL